MKVQRDDSGSAKLGAVRHQGNGDGTAGVGCRSPQRAHDKEPAVESPARPTPISGLEGHRLGPYDLLDLIGRGGMAIVYKALQPNLRRYVAIKVLPPSFVHEEGFLRRFQQEAEVVAQLEHPNILPIYDYGQEGNIPYIVMPLVSGGTLYDWLGQSRPLDQAVQVFSRLLSALEYAHTHRVVHRDIKPSNVLMREDDWPLLTDFGIAKIV